MSFTYSILAQCCHYIDTSLLIYSENQWASFYIMAILGSFGSWLFFSKWAGIVFQWKWFHIFDKNQIHLKENKTLNAIDSFLIKHFHNIVFSTGSIGSNKKSFLSFQVCGNNVEQNDCYHQILELECFAKKVNIKKLTIFTKWSSLMFDRVLNILLDAETYFFFYLFSTFQNHEPAQWPCTKLFLLHQACILG